MRFRKALAATAVLVVLGAAAPVAALTTPEASPAARLDGLLVQQLADASTTDQLPVFVHAGDIATARAAARAAGLTVVDTFDRVGVAVAAGTPVQIQAAAVQPGVSFLEADRPMTFFMETSHIATRGEEARTAFQDRMVTTTTTTRPPKPNGKPGKPVTTTTTEPAFAEEIDGRGTTIAVIDSGIDGTHPMFQVDTDGDGETDASKVVRNLKHLCPSGVVIPLAGPCIGDPVTTTDPVTGAPYGDAHDEAWVDVTDLGNDTDNLSAGGHGTHVAGIAAGVDVTTADGRSLHGAAPGADLIGLSVGTSVSVSSGYAGMNWVLEHHEDPCGDLSCEPIRVVNNSWGNSGPYDPESAGAKLQDELVADGVVVVWAAGNAGGDGSRDAVNPAAKSPTPGVLNVASYDDLNTGTRDGVVSGSSSRGDADDPRTFPDVSAPGNNITSACRITLTVCDTGGDFADPDYNTISGTSMAAPHISGIVAQLLQVDPTSTPAEIEQVLEDTAYKFANGADYEPDPRNSSDTTSFDKGHGLVDVVAAVESILGLAPSGPSEPPPSEPTDPGDADLTLASGESGEVSGELHGFTGNYVCSGPGDDFCPTRVIAIDPDGPTGQLTLMLDPVAGGDLDLRLFDASNQEVASSVTRGSNLELIEVDLPAGSYSLVVQPFVGAEATPWWVTASLD